ncbi:hypothetical protein H6F74_06215 [Trichocoleus sp. FACHB-90]|nr:hypothetical protein [Trichocoleus sp. FACHB-90]MBD1925880.1 hypothetical protein [Trichocoleus sp. FACHB-90]
MNQYPLPIYSRLLTKPRNNQRCTLIGWPEFSDRVQHLHDWSQVAITNS